MCREKMENQTDIKRKDDIDSTNNNDGENNNYVDDKYDKKYNKKDNHILTKLLASKGIVFKSTIKWDKVFLISLAHLVALYACLVLDPWNHIRTTLWGN
jgi:hypothetical protein